MKALNVFIIILFTGILTSCTTSGDGLDFTTTWNLTNVTGGFAGVDHTFERGLIKWTFYEEDSVIEVTNSNEVESLIDIFETGTYPYSIEEIDSEYRIFINGSDFGTIYKTSKIMVIDQQFADGFKITLTR